MTKSNNQTNLQVQKTELYAGPLPHPDTLKKFEEILPGAADRILKQAENQTQHRIEMESKVINADIRKSYVGLVFGFLIGILGIGGGIYLATLGFDIFGPVLSSGTLVSIIVAFIYGTKSRKEEREKRFEKLR